MAQTLVSSSAVHAAPQTEKRHLRFEKLGVIAGFLVGLPMALGAVGEVMHAAGAPAWVTDAGAVAAIGACTWAGLALASALLRRIESH